MKQYLVDLFKQIDFSPTSLKSYSLNTIHSFYCIVIVVVFVIKFLVFLVSVYFFKQITKNKGRYKSFFSTIFC